MFIQKLPIGLMVLAAATSAVAYGSSWDLALQSTETARTRAQRADLSTAPVEGVVTSSFGQRVNPFTQKRSEHKGIDIAAAEGTPIYSGQMGRVTFAGDAGTYGNMVEVLHLDGSIARYAHASVVEVKVGQRIHKGDTLGLVGSTGAATGPHLHYELLANGQHINPAAHGLAGLIGEQVQPEQQVAAADEDSRQNELLIASVVQTYAQDVLLAVEPAVDVSSSQEPTQASPATEVNLVARLVPFRAPAASTAFVNQSQKLDLQNVPTSHVSVDAKGLRASIEQLRQSVIHSLV